MKALGTLIPRDMRVGIIRPKQGWDVSSFYKVAIALTPENPVHYAILITDPAFNPKRMQGTIWNPQTGCFPIHEQEPISYLEVVYKIENLI